MTWMLICSIFFFLPAQDTAAVKSISPERVASFQRALEKAVFTALPTPLYEGSDHWGDKKKSVNGMKWTPKPELQYADKNHGTWRKYRVTLDQPSQDHLKLKVNDVKSLGNNSLSFQIKVDADIEFDVEQQNWQAGIKLFDGFARGGATVKMVITCESKLTIEPGVNLFPVIKYRLHVMDAKASYDRLVFTHVPGLGGSAAKVVGNWTVDAVNQMKPSLERKLIGKLTEKLKKVADTKEIQVSLSGIERKK
ncbi:MAG TPA: hypothetical protein PLN21_06190 [Gemmatales bacterium]|nr:hypothetical protein [Gemmatales bacterium]